jgi:hypothetical protein
MPTLLELVGLPVPAASEGISLGPALKTGEAIPSRTLYCGIPSEVSAYRDDDILFLRRNADPKSSESSWRPHGLRWSPNRGVAESDEPLALLSEAQAYIRGAVPTIEAELLTPEEVRRPQALGYAENDGDDSSP